MFSPVLLCVTEYCLLVPFPNLLIRSYQVYCLSFISSFTDVEVYTLLHILQRPSLEAIGLSLFLDGLIWGFIRLYYRKHL